MERSFLPRPRFNPIDHPRLFQLIVNIWPPYLGAAISVEEIARDWRTIRVALRLRWYNCNYVKSHFGGSLFSMTDPFYMLMLIRNLGPGYVVWDMAARIHYLKPGRGTVTAFFTLGDDRLEDIRRKAESGEKVIEIFLVDVVDGQGEKVATVKKTLYIRKKKPAGAVAGMEGIMENKRADTVPAPAIVSAAWGRTEVAGLGPGKDWKLWPGGGCSWDWSEHGTGHFQGIQPGDLEELLDRGCQVVILTTGRLGRLKVAPATIEILEAKGVQVIVARTGKGIDIYNNYAGQGVAVGGLFHATC
ncbi:MAG: MTH938/NDUFAF3 family protein [Desulforhopalus sp.]|nr:MTH938/NDUFAF3 family protein [Desulforhopalus sp.]